MAACSTTRRNSSERSESIRSSGRRSQRRSSTSSSLRVLHGRQLAARRPIGRDSRAGSRPASACGSRACLRRSPRPCSCGRSGRPDTRPSSRWRRGSAPRRRPRAPTPTVANHLASPVSRVLRRPLFFSQPGAQPEQPRRLIVRLHLRDHFLDELVLRRSRRRTSSRSFAYFDARVAAGADQAGRAGRHRVAALVEREHRDLEAFARPGRAVLLGHLDVVHLEEAGVAREDAPLLLHRAAGESLERRARR